MRWHGVYGDDSDIMYVVVDVTSGHDDRELMVVVITVLKVVGDACGHDTGHNGEDGQMLMVLILKTRTNLKITFAIRVSGASSHPSLIPGATILLNVPFDTTFPW